MASMALLALSVSPATISSCSAVQVVGAVADNASHAGNVGCYVALPQVAYGVCGRDSYSTNAVIGRVRAQQGVLGIKRERAGIFEKGIGARKQTLGIDSKSLQPKCNCLACLIVTMKYIPLISSYQLHTSATRCYSLLGLTWYVLNGGQSRTFSLSGLTAHLFVVVYSQTVRLIQS